MDTLLLKEYAVLCGIAYEPLNKALSSYIDKGYKATTLTQPLELEQVFSLRKGTQLIIIITGTNQIRDWLINILAIPGSYLHTGYSTIATALISPVTEEYIMGKVEKVTILGHSKGGGVAAILGYYLAHLPIEVVTYGAPRIASEAFALIYPNEKYERVVHPHDIVARLPSHIGYRHCGKPVVWNGIEYTDSLKAWIDAQKNHPTIELFIRAYRSYKAHISYWL
jgi:hypothetical protein